MAIPLRLEKYTVGENDFLLFVPEREAIAASYRRGENTFPYWSQVWPAAVGLTQFLLQHPQFISGKKVLELAAGLGLPSLVAATLDAASVVASDYVPEAVAAMRQTFTHHGFAQATAQMLDWTNLPDTLAAEVLLLSDVSYDEKLFVTQEKVIHDFVQKGTTVIISTPQRLIARQAMAPLLPFCTQQDVQEVQHRQQPVAVSVFVLKG